MIFYLCCLVEGPGIKSVILYVFASFLTVTARTDARYLYIPDGIHILILLLGLASIILCCQLGILECMAGSFICGGLPKILRILTRGGVGGEDVEPLASSGFLFGARTKIASVFMVHVIASLRYLIPLLRGRVNGKTSVPMALSFGLLPMVCRLWYSEIVAWYLGLFFP